MGIEDSIPLPVVQSGDPPRSRTGRWRALSLVLVHILIAAHIAYWAWRGSTLSPLEPSEAGHSIRDGAINAGAVFLVALIGSTLIFGRLFCGWACHLVAYQDLTRWLLLKVGVRPRPLRSRLLLFVPLFAAYWLYGKPLVDRWLAGAPAPGLSWRLTTEHFWTTFPGWTISILTFLVCGFGIVYVLGAKGFCAYGCPYGGLFGIADRFAPGRVRVTDACDGSGQCTANCSSNVNVAREVREHGMVVDPGCLKCLDCVSVCPNDALYFGFTVKATAPRARFRRLAFLYAPQTILALLLGIGCAVLFRRSWGAGVLAALGVTIGAAAWQLVAPPGRRAGRPSERPGCTLAEELFLAGVFVVAFATFFRAYRMVPLLMAIALAVIAASLALVTLRLLYAPRVRLQNLVLKADGRWRPAAWGLIVVALLGAAGLAHGAVVQWHTHASPSRTARSNALRTSRCVSPACPRLPSASTHAWWTSFGSLDRTRSASTNASTARSRSSSGASSTRSVSERGTCARTRVRRPRWSRKSSKRSSIWSSRWASAVGPRAWEERKGRGTRPNATTAEASTSVVASSRASSIAAASARAVHSRTASISVCAPTKPRPYAANARVRDGTAPRSTRRRPSASSRSSRTSGSTPEGLPRIPSASAAVSETSWLLSGRKPVNVSASPPARGVYAPSPIFASATMAPVKTSFERSSRNAASRAGTTFSRICSSVGRRLVSWDTCSPRPMNHSSLPVTTEPAWTALRTSRKAARLKNHQCSQESVSNTSTSTSVPPAAPVVGTWVAPADGPATGPEDARPAPPETAGPAGPP